MIFLQKAHNLNLIMCKISDKYQLGTFYKVHRDYGLTLVRDNDCQPHTNILNKFQGLVMK